jgi:hypothetical protein
MGEEPHVPVDGVWLKTDHYDRSWLGWTSAGAFGVAPGVRGQSTRRSFAASTGRRSVRRTF